MERPRGVVVMGGIATSTAPTLVVLPVPHSLVTPDRAEVYPEEAGAGGTGR